MGTYTIRGQISGGKKQYLINGIGIINYSNLKVELQLDFNYI